MTELQPSPPGYRGQDEAPGPSSSGVFEYSGRLPEAPNYKGPGYYPQEGYCHEGASRALSNGDYYKRRDAIKVTDDVIRNHECLKKDQFASYNDGYKKNTPGYKNDSGYCESLGFDSFNLPLNERDEASPPPTPPVRDASSLKGVCYGPGHEKYPSWPSAPERHADNDPQNCSKSGSHRSKSWTDHTNYPKEKPAQYTRPHSKRPNPSYTRQLKTVMERCEKIPTETFEYRARNEEEPRLWPRLDRDGKSLGDVEYVVPSPPERERQSLSHADLEAYVRSYQDPRISRVDMYRETSLTEAGLDEYGMVQHAQQASYAQSEGYHSYVSSVDSTTTTPFLDRLRRDSEAVAQRPPTSSWDDNSREGRDSVVTTSSGSASSSETLKWHGSMSDVSVSSGIPTRSIPVDDRWHRDDCLSDIGSTISPGYQKSSNETLNETTTKTEWHAEHFQVARAQVPVTTHLADDVCSDVALVQSSKQLIAHSARVQTPQRHLSESVLYLDRERSQRKLYAIGTSVQNKTEGSQSSRNSSSSHTQPLSVAERISELEKHQSQQMRYTYLDPEKRHRVSDPTLKAIQKKALLSFYERHQQAFWRSEPHLAPSPQSSPPPPQPPPRPRQASSRRASSASDYANGNWRNKTNRTQNGSEMPNPKHRHSNSCGSLSTDLLGPVIVGPTISIDDWVPERPPKKPHLREVFVDGNCNERVPSPDLPPPSPPAVLENEVLNSDEPLPPPPPELSQDQSNDPDSRKQNPDLAPRIERHKPNRRSSTRRVRNAKMSPCPSEPVTPQPWPAIARSTAVFAETAEKPLTTGFTSQRSFATARSSLRYSGKSNSTQKLVINGKAVGASPQVGQNMEKRTRPPARLPLESGSNKSFNDAIVRHNSMRLETRQIPQPQVPRSENVTTPKPKLDSNSPSPPPLAPRLATPLKPLPPPPPRPAPPRTITKGSQSKASFLSYREKGAPDSKGSYKRTMSPTSRVDEWMASDEPVLLRVSPIQNRSNKCSPKKEFSKSNSIDNLISSLEESSKPSAKLENGEVHRNGTSEHSDKLNGFRENDRLSPANDSNRQRKDSGDPICADFYCEIGTTIEMTSRNVELLNQKNAEKRELRIGADERSRSKFGSRSSSCSSASNSLSDKQQRLSPAEPASPRSPSQKSIISSLSSEVFFPRKTSSPSQTESFVSWESRLKSRSLSKGDRSSRCSNASSSSLGSSLSPLDSPTTCTPQSGVEELTLVQRSEVVLRVNASTSDAASQTEVIAEEPMNRPPERKKSPEEIECEELSRDLASQLSPNDKLVPILVPIPERKKPEDYVSGLFWNDARPRTRRRLSLEDSLTASSENGSEEEKKIDSVPTSPLTPSPTNTCNPLSPTSPYFTISESRARFLTRYTHDMSDRNGTEGDNKHVTVDSLELRRKKEELVIRLDRKLVVLRAEQDAVREESELNEALGARVTNRVAVVARPMEASKYRLHVEEVGKITSLLLGLSGRLARAENALFGMSDDDPEKKILESKKDKLVEQLEEAKILKSNIDKRSVIVSNILSKYLNDEEFADYQHFINMKSKLLVEAREIQDKVKLGEEQLAALRERID